jgi:serine phosphatase RsbU (regulator of sigma subunit)
LKTIFPQSFIYFVPKDIVSGDFYWIKQNTEKNTVCLAVADCTGHGVPGSMLSMLGISFLNEIQQQQIKHTPASVLNHLRDKFVEVTGNANAKKSLNDGMDIGLAEIDYHRHKLKFAGANRDVYVLRESEIIVIKGDNMPIGRYIKTDKFSVQEFDLQPGDCIYLFTDGYNDQFGGKKNEKFKRRNFKKLLLAIQDLEFEEQMDVIQKMHNHWRGQNTQVDDILIIGFQFNPENPFKTNQISSLDSLEISN